MPDRIRSDGKRPNYQPSNVKRMTEPEAAWVGAIIEGEGTVAFRPSTSGHMAKVSVVNTDVEIISALLRATGAGTVHTRMPAPDNVGKREYTFGGCQSGERYKT